MKRKVTTRLMGAEVEYFCSSNDDSFESVSEYYSGMREVNSILLPCSDVLGSLMILKGILEKLDSKLHHKLGTRGWANSYGFAYNGVHLHLSGNINQKVLEKNIFRLMDKYGLSPRTVTSWHVFSRPTSYNLKNKRKHQPVYKTPRDTLEIRVLDVEYFLDAIIIEDLAIAIEAAYSGEVIPGNDTWVKNLLKIPLEDYKGSLKLMEKNLAAGWTKNQEGVYINNNGNYDLDFRGLPEWNREEERAREQRLRDIIIPTFDAGYLRVDESPSASWDESVYVTSTGETNE